MNYPHFLRLAEGAQWDAEEVDLRADRAAWPMLAEDARARIGGLLAGFSVGETAVASEIEPFAPSAPDASMAACFAAQEVDERRHARFFQRVAAEVLDADDATMRARAPAALVALFEQRLPAVARRLAHGGEGLGAAVGLYHMVLEGVVFLAGQHALLEALERAGGALAVVRHGLELVLRDERWHVGFGARCLQDVGPAGDVLSDLVTEGEKAAGAWGDLVSEAQTARAAALHRRRLAAAGLLAPPAPAPTP